MIAGEKQKKNRMESNGRKDSELLGKRGGERGGTQRTVENGALENGGSGQTKSFRLSEMK